MAARRSDEARGYEGLRGAHASHRSLVQHYVFVLVVLASMVLLGVTACDAGGRAPFCRLGAEHEVMRTSAKDLDGIALAVVQGRALAVWSEQGGLFGRWLDGDAQPLAPPARLGVRCEGGIAAESDGDAAAIACLLRPESGKQDAPGGVLLARVHADLGFEQRPIFGSAGRLSAGVALARGAHGLEVAWHDGSPEAQRVWWGSWAGGAAAARLASEPGRLASAPSLTSQRGATVLAWAENWVEGADLRSRIVIFERSSPPRTLVPQVHVAATPQLVALGARLVLGFRDRRAHEKIGLYLLPVAPEAAGARAQSSVRVGRADGVGKPALVACMGGVVVATPRTYGGDYFVGVNFLDQGLERARGEQQFYEDAHAFTQVAAACAGSHALLLIAEFPQLHRETMALRAVPYRCEAR